MLRNPEICFQIREASQV